MNQYEVPLEGSDVGHPAYDRRGYLWIGAVGRGGAAPPAVDRRRDRRPARRASRRGPGRGRLAGRAAGARGAGRAGRRQDRRAVDPGRHGLPHRPLRRGAHGGGLPQRLSAPQRIGASVTGATSLAWLDDRTLATLGCSTARRSSRRCSPSAARCEAHAGAGAAAVTATGGERDLWVVRRAGACSGGPGRSGSTAGPRRTWPSLRAEVVHSRPGPAGLFHSWARRLSAGCSCLILGVRRADDQGGACAASWRGSGGGLVLPARCAACHGPGAPLCRRCAAAVRTASAGGPFVVRLALHPRGCRAAARCPVRGRAAPGRHRLQGRGPARPATCPGWGSRGALGSALSADPVLRRRRAHGNGVLVVPLPTAGRSRRRRGDDPVVDLARTAVEAVGGGLGDRAAAPPRWARRGSGPHPHALSGRPGAPRPRVTGGQPGGAITVLRGWRAVVQGAVCVLVDDVVTTGATLGRRASPARGGSRACRGGDHGGDPTSSTRPCGSPDRRLASGHEPRSSGWCR